LDKDVLIFGIRRGVIEITCVAIAVFVLLCVLLVSFAGAIDSYAIVNTSSNETSNTSIAMSVATKIIDTTAKPTPIPTIAVARKITQGSCVELGETIDFTGIGWSETISYFGRYYDGYGERDDNPDKEFRIPSYKRRNYYISNATFSQYLGWWYSHSDQYEPNSFSRLFYVSRDCNTTNKLWNKTEIQPVISQNITEPNTINVITEMTLPDYKLDGIDFIVSRNTRTNIGSGNATTAWFFGANPSDAFYNISTHNGNVILSEELVARMPAGTYAMYIIAAGENKILETLYDSRNKMVSSPFRDVEDIPVAIGDVAVTRSILESKVASTIDDKYEVKMVALQEPSITIREMIPQTYPNGTVMQVIGGYTNANPGDTIRIYFDKENIDPAISRQYIWVAAVDPYNGVLGSYRTWNTTITIDPGKFAPGTHTLTAIVDENNARMDAPFYIKATQDPDYIPPPTIQYIDNYPIAPTPTPIVITNTVEKEVIKTVVTEKIIEIPVDYDILATYQVKKALPYVIGGSIALIVMIYLLYSGSRAYVRKLKAEKGYARISDKDAPEESKDIASQIKTIEDLFEDEDVK